MRYITAPRFIAGGRLVGWGASAHRVSPQSCIECTTFADILYSDMYGDVWYVQCTCDSTYVLSAFFIRGHVPGHEFVRRAVGGMIDINTIEFHWVATACQWPTNLMEQKHIHTCTETTHTINHMVKWPYGGFNIIE